MEIKLGTAKSMRIITVPTGCKEKTLCQQRVFGAGNNLKTPPVITETFINGGVPPFIKVSVIQYGKVGRVET